MTINFGSIMRMKIRKVKKRYDDLVINIPINTLAKYAGDFDGDAGNTISLKDTELVDAYELYDPRTHMMISKTDGLFDEDFNLIKDQLIGLHQFCKLSRVKIGYRRLDKNNKKSKKQKKENKSIKIKSRRIIKVIKRKEGNKNAS